MGTEKNSELEAQQYCEDEMDANMLKINSQEENNFIVDLVKEHAPTAKHIWIGLKWEKAPKHFFWYDQSVPTFTNWGPGEPNGGGSEPCVAMYALPPPNALPQRATGYWNDVSCVKTDVIAVCKRLY